MKYFFIACFIVLTGTSWSQPCGSPPTINFNFNTITICPGEEATPIATVIGAVGSIQYNWFPEPGNTNTITVSPTAETWYYLEITDDCFTVLDSMHVVPDPVEITSINITDATNCPGEPGTLGSIQVIPDNPDFIYTLSGAGITTGPQLSATFSNLPGGVGYFLHVENSHDCFLDTAIMVGLGTNNVTASFNSSALQGTTCFESADGAAEITGIGGGITSPYNVYWTNASGLYATQTGLTAGDGNSQTNLPGGQWAVTVEDQNGCAWSEIFYVNHPDEILIDFVSANPTCYQFTDGSFTFNASGGNGGNSFVITNSTGLQIPAIPGPNNLGEGWYFVEVTDMEGCVGYDSVYLDAPEEIAADITVTDLICSYDGNGSIVVNNVYNFQGDDDLVAYFWNPNPNGINGIGANENTGLNGGNYTLTINDEYGCSKVFDILVSPESIYFVNLSSSPWSGSADGTVYCIAGGGTPPYTYTWTNLSTSATYTGSIWDGLQPGMYEIEVTDDNGCVLVDTIWVGQLAMDEINAEKYFSVYPKLVQNSLLNVENQLQSEAVFTLYNLSGELVFSSNLNQGKNELLLNLSDGTYFYEVKSGQMVSRGKIVTVRN